MKKIFLRDSLYKGKVCKIDSDNSHHLKVLKVKKGDMITVGDADAKEFTARVVFIKDNEHKIEITKENPTPPKPSKDLTLFVSVPKRNKFEEVVFRCTQVGVSRFVPIVTERTEKIPIRSKSKFFRRSMKKASHAAEISGRAEIPVVSDIMSFDEALKHYSESSYETGIIFWENEKNKKCLKHEEVKSPAALFIGPEGGLNPDEVEKADRAGLKRRTLGSLVMDVETACIAASSVALLK